MGCGLYLRGVVKNRRGFNMDFRNPMRKFKIVFLGEENGKK